MPLYKVKVQVELTIDATNKNKVREAVNDWGHKSDMMSGNTKGFYHLKWDGNAKIVGTSLEEK